MRRLPRLVLLASPLAWGGCNAVADIEPATLRGGDAGAPLDAAAADAGPADGDAMTAPCDRLAPDANDIYVNIGATRAGVGASPDCPLRTVTAAVAAANQSTAASPTVHVAPGVYDVGAGELFPIAIVRAMSIVGAGVSSVTLRGTGKLDHSQAGGALNGSSYQVTILVSVPSGAATISGVAIEASVSAPTQDFYGIVCDRGNAPTDLRNPPVDPFPAPNLVVENSRVGPNYGEGLVVTNIARPLANACNVRVTGSTFTGDNDGAWLVGCGIGDDGQPIAAQFGDGTEAGRNTFTSLKSDGIDVWDCVATVRALTNTFQSSENGIIAAMHSNVDVAEKTPFLALNGNSFTNLRTHGVGLGNSAVITELIGNTFTNITAASGATAPSVAMDAINVVTNATDPHDQPTIRRARNNTFIGNDIAVRWQGNPLTIPGGMVNDFGTAQDPGMNVFKCNSTPVGSPFVGYDVVVAVQSNGGAALSFVGNQWDHAPATKLTAASGTNGTDILLSGAAPQPVVDASMATLAPGSCPPNRVAGP